MPLNILLSVAGFFILIKCADFFVEGASSFAKNLKIPASVIGLTIVAFGTSAPELAISFNSRLSGNADMLFGNVIGSNIANILVILGLAVLIVPFQICNDVIKKEIPILLLVTLGLSTLFLDNLFDPSRANSLTRADGVTLILFFSIFVYYLITLLSDGKNKNANETPRYKTLKSVIIIALGLTGVILGSGLVVDNVAAFAERIGISQKIISVTIISIGTSLPELVTTVMAAKKGENNMAIGNIVGSNIFNACIVLGLPVIVLGEAATAAFNAVDMTFMSLSVVLLWIFSSTNRKLKRYEAVIFMLVYCGYGGYILMQ
ncbi:MAG: calcium/sodium antiporter [Oscillospiraceae bacterium]|nr:calcium/sodium antiporter [Oscillospiraceae bacterium]